MWTRVTRRSAEPNAAGASGASRDGTRAAVRQQAAHVLDVRLIGGLALVALSAVAGAMLLGRDQDTVTVWQATRDLSVGSPVLDAEAVTIPRSPVSDQYLGPTDDRSGVLVRPVSAGELVPRAAVVADSDRPRREVTVPVDPLHAPPGLLPGDAVDVWASGDESSATPPRLVLDHVIVANVADEDTGLSGRLGVVLSVPEEDVADLVAATRTGELDLVAVPVDGQVVAAGDAA